MTDAIDILLIDLLPPMQAASNLRYLFQTLVLQVDQLQREWFREKLHNPAKLTPLAGHLARLADAEPLTALLQAFVPVDMARG